jgi:hypothetical protein
MPCVRTFAVRICLGARQSGALLCGVSTAHGEKTHVKKYFVVQFSLGAWQTFFPPPDGTPFDDRRLFVPFVVRQNKVHGKDIPIVVRFPPAHDKHTPSYGARQSIFKNFDFCTSFYFSTTKILFCTLLQHVMHHVKIW